MARCLCYGLLVAAVRACDECYCGTSWGDANTHCQVSCHVNDDCPGAQSCFGSCTACGGGSPTPSPTPAGPCTDPIIPTGSCAALGRHINNFSIWDPQLVCGGAPSCKLNCTAQNSWPQAGTNDATCAIGADGAATLLVTGSMSAAGYFTLNVPLLSMLYPRNAGGAKVLGKFDLLDGYSGVRVRYATAVPLSVQIRPAWCLHGGSWMNAFGALPPTTASKTATLRWADFAGQTGAQCDGENPVATSAAAMTPASNRNLTLSQAFSFVFVATAPSLIRFEALELVPTATHR